MMSSICRLCMNRYASSGSMENIFFGEAFIVETIRTVTQIEVVEGDGLPQYVCLLCIFKLNDAKNFIQSCIECNEKLKLECLVQTTASVTPVTRRPAMHTPDAVFLISPSAGPCSQHDPVISQDSIVHVGSNISTAGDEANSLSPVTMLAAGFPRDLKTELSSPNETESAAKIEECGTNVQSILCQLNNLTNVHSIAELTNTVQDCLKTEPIEESELLNETDAADINGHASYNESSVAENDMKTEHMAITHSRESGSMSELAQSNTSLEIKRELIAVFEESVAETTLHAEADEAEVNLHQRDSQFFKMIQETNNIGSCEVDHVLTDVAPLLNATLLATVEDLSLGTSSELVSLCQANTKRNDTLNITNEANVKCNAVSKTQSSTPSLKVLPKQASRSHQKPKAPLTSFSQRKRRLQCPKCLQVFSQLSIRRQHACVSTGSSGATDSEAYGQKFKCNDCSAGFSFRSSLETHQKTHTKNPNNGQEIGSESHDSDFDANRCSRACGQKFKCNDCPAGFSFRSSLETHQKTHAKNPNVCKEIGSESHDSDFDVNSSDSENSIFELHIPDSEDSNQDFKSSYSESEGSVVKSHLDSDDCLFSPYSDSCEMDVVSLESEDCGLRLDSDLDEPDIDTSLESEGSGLRPNSDSERSSRDTSVESGASTTNPGIGCCNLDSERSGRYTSVESGASTTNPDIGRFNPDSETAASPINAFDFGQNMVTSSPNAECKKKIENEVQVGSTPTLAQQSSQQKLSLLNAHELLLNDIAKPHSLEENLAARNGSDGSDVTHSAPTTSIESSTRILRSGQGKCLAELFIHNENAGSRQRSRKTNWDDEIPSSKRVRRSSSELGSPEKCSKRKDLPCVMPGESGGVLASVGPVCKRTRGRMLSDGRSNISPRVELGPKCNIVKDLSKNSIVRSGKKKDSAKEGEVAVPMTKKSCEVNKEKNHKERDLSNSSVEATQTPDGTNKESAMSKEMVGIRTGETVGLKRTIELNSYCMQQEKGNAKEKIGKGKEIEQGVQGCLKARHTEHKTKINVGEITQPKRNGGKNGKLINSLKKRSKAKQDKEMAGSRMIIKETVKSITNSPGKDMAANVVLGSKNSSGRKSETESSIEESQVSEIAGSSSRLEMSRFRKVSKRRSLHCAVPAEPYQCWECTCKFACGSELITHFSRHLRASLVRHSL